MDFYGSVLLTCHNLHYSAETACAAPFPTELRCNKSTYVSSTWDSPSAGLLWSPKCYQTHFDARAQAMYLGRVS